MKLFFSLVIFQYKPNFSINALRPASDENAWVFFQTLKCIFTSFRVPALESSAGDTPASYSIWMHSYLGAVDIGVKLGVRIYGVELDTRIYGVELPTMSPPRLRRA